MRRWAADDLAREFDATAGRYDTLTALNPGYHEHLDRAASVLCAGVGSVPAPTLIDLGCGSGSSTAALVAQLERSRMTNATVVGVDASEGMLAQARQKTWPAGVRFEHGLAEDVIRRAKAWSLAPPVDGVFACYLFRNVVDRDATLGAVHDSLAPGGWLVVQEYSVAGSARAVALWSLVCWAIVIPLSLLLTGRTVLYRYLWRSVLRFDSVSDFMSRMSRAGFADISVQTASGWQGGILHTFVARRPLTS